MTGRTINFGDFTLSRTMPASASKLFQAFADKDAKEKWFGAPTETSGREHTMNFREGGSEMAKGIFHDGVTHTFQATYYEIIPDERIIYSYEMFMNDQRISVSVATIEFQAISDNSCQLTLHESGAFLDGLDSPQQRQHGTEQLLEQLAESVK